MNFVNDLEGYVSKSALGGAGGFSAGERSRRVARALTVRRSGVKRSDSFALGGAVVPAEFRKWPYTQIRNPMAVREFERAPMVLNAEDMKWLRRSSPADRARLAEFMDSPKRAGRVSKRDLRDFERPRRVRHGDTLRVRGKTYTVSDQVNSPLKRGLYSLAAAGGAGARLSLPVRQSRANKHFFFGPSAVRNVESYDPASRAARLRVRRTSGAERAAERQGHMIAGGVGGAAAAGVAAGYAARRAPKRGLIIPATALAGAGLGALAGSRVRPRSHALEYVPPR